MPYNYPILPDDRKQFFAVWHGLPEDKKESLYKAFQRKYCLFVLQGWSEVPSRRTHNREEKMHLLLAYKYLGWTWFKDLPESEDELFMIYVSDDIPQDQGPGDVNDTFDMSQEELQRDCKDIEKPKWAKRKSTKRVLITIQSFPFEVK